MMDLDDWWGANCWSTGLGLDWWCKRQRAGTEFERTEQWPRNFRNWLTSVNLNTLSWFRAECLIPGHIFSTSNNVEPWIPPLPLLLNSEEVGEKRLMCCHYKEMAVKLTESWQKFVRIDECRIVVLSFVNFGIFRSSWQIFVNFSWRLQRGFTKRSLIHSVIVFTERVHVS